jgi:Fe-S cluster assembly iron-binding protein IscA
MRGTHILAVVLLAQTGCSPKPAATPAVVPSNPPPVVEVTPIARDVLVRVAAEQKFGADWWVRLRVVWTPGPEIEVTVERAPPGPADEVHESNGLKVALPRDQAVYLKGARVDLLKANRGAAFDVTFPYRTDSDRERANHWLLTESFRKGKAD